MNNIALHMRISSVDVTDNEVESRQAAAIGLATNWKKEKDLYNIVSISADVAQAVGGDGIPSFELGNKVQAAIQKKSPAYLYDERPLDIGICAGMAMVSILNGSPSSNGWMNTDLYAVALWSVLSFQPELEDGRREQLRSEVLTAALNWSLISAEKARERVDVPNPVDVKIHVDENSIATSNFREVIANTIEALRRNSALDREELDFLWWAQLGYSRIIKRQISEITEPTRIVTAAIEGAKLLRRFPCEVHREIILRTLDKNPKLDLAELITAIDNDRIVLISEFNNEIVLGSPVVFPLLYALCRGEATGLGSTVKRTVSEWGERALVEATLARLMSNGIGKI